MTAPARPRGSRAAGVCFLGALAIGGGMAALLRQQMFGLPAWALGWLAPAAAFGALWLLARTGRMAAASASRGAVALAVVCLLALPFALLFSTLEAVTTPTDNPAHYAQARALCGQGTEAFPAEVPPGAQAVDFWYNAPFMQGGNRLQLAYSGGDASALEAAAASALWSGPLAEAPAQYAPLTWLDMAMPPDATVHILACRPGSDGTWNHGLFACAAHDGVRTCFLYENW